ncbi:translocation/assembly module TamB domain-containing protein [Coraliomargarita parva]|uniref:translocation/assembly module TamB domain-containing protein n=1 Tax=Coraliomargarita parva TaxID=3014050 RepID=UPI0022B38657|nr:translocation/assembly module TamB domain-containing protein [Coraliomargarita parva]
MKQRRYRTILYGGLLILAASLVLFFSSAVWLPWVLPGVLSHYGVHVGKVERAGMDWIRAESVGYEEGSLVLHLDEIRVPALHRYFWAYIRGRLDGDTGVEAGHMRVELAPVLVGGESQVDLVREYRQYAAKWKRIKNWIPELRLESFRLVQAGQDRLHLHSLVREGDRLRGRLRVVDDDSWLVEMDLRMQESGGMELDLKLPGQALSGRFELTVTQDALVLEGRVDQGNDRIQVSGSIPAGALLPDHLEVRSDSWALKPEWWRSPELARLESVHLDYLNLHWEKDRYRGRLVVTAFIPGKERASLEPVLELELSGDLTQIRFQRVEVRSAWAQASLTKPVVLQLPGFSFEQAASLSLRTDLSQQPFFPVEGQLELGLDFLPKKNGPGQIRFHLSGSALRYAGYEADLLALRGQFEDGLIRMDEGELRLDGADGGELHFNGLLDWKGTATQVEYNADLSAGLVNRCLGGALVRRPVQVSGSLRGGLDKPRLSLHLTPTPVQLEGFRLLQLALDATSEGLKQWKFEASAATPDEEANLELSGSLEQFAGAFRVQLEQLDWLDRNYPDWQLESPGRIEWLSPGQNRSDWLKRLLVTPLRFSGTGSELQLTSSEDGGLSLTMQGVQAGRLNAWLKAPQPDYTLTRVDFRLGRLRPWIEAELGFSVAQATAEDAQLQLDGRLQLDAEGTAVPAINLVFNGESQLSGALRLPLRFAPPATGRDTSWELSEAGSLEGRFRGQPSDALVSWLESTYGVILQGAALDGALSGSLLKPEGTIRAVVKGLRFKGGGDVQMPGLNGLELDMKLDSDVIRVERLDCRLRGGRLEANGEWTTEAFRRFIQSGGREGVAFLESGSGHVAWADWSLQNWTPYLPAIVRQSGTLEGWVDFNRGAQLQGEAAFQDFALRPTMPFPSVDAIQGRVRLEGRRFELEDVSARVSGSPIHLKGQLDFSDLKVPAWQLSLQGERVPLVRTADLILRSDLDLTAEKTSTMPVPKIQGSLNLRSSILLVEFDLFSRDVDTGSTRRPPFFSVRSPTYRDWDLDVAIQGDSFMRVRSPYFKSSLSANFKLDGTLGEPRLIGSAYVVDGEVRFPGGKMRLDEAEAYIDPARADVVQLRATGIAQVASYVITMEVSETMQDPQVVFQASPALSNAAIARLLATGSTSGGGAGTVGLYLGRGLLGSSSMKESIADRFTIDLGEETTRSGNSTYGVRYDLNEDLYLKGEYDIYDAYNVDLIWSIFNQ